MRFSEQERKTMKEFFRNLSFTKSEVRVILFLTAVLTSGFAIKYYRQVVAGSVVKNYDYKGTDEEFKRLSDNFNHRIATEDSGKSTENIEIADTSLINEMAASEDSLKSLKVIPAEDTNTDLVFEVIDINTASKEQLTGLPGVGESTAEKIISYRYNNKFRKAEDIMNVKGIGKKKFGKMKNFIKTE